MEDAYQANAPSASISADALVDSLNEGIIRSVQTSGKTLPTSSVRVPSPSSFRCEWTEYSSELCCPSAEDLRQHFPPLDGSEVGSDGRPLFYAACLGLLLSRRPDDAVPSGASTPLSTFLSIASFLLDELDVDPNQPTRTEGACSRPPLHLVARSCHPSAVRRLLRCGADPNLPDEEGWTALMACCLPDVPSREQGGPTVEERVETARVLLKGTDSDHDAADVDARNYCGYSALHYACEGLNSSLIQCLLEDGGADATLRNVWGQSCIGIIKSQSCDDNDEAARCEAIISTHLEKTGRMGRVRSFLEEETKAIELANLLEELLLPASRRPEPDDGNGSLAAQDRRIITALMEHLNLDPEPLFQSNAFANFPHRDGNLYETIHDRIMGIVPHAYRQVYQSNPTDEEREVITCTNYNLRKAAETSAAGARRIDAAVMMSLSFRLHRERGHVAQQLELLNDLIVGPLQRTLAFGVPSNAALKEIAARAPRIIEVGAGTGYWSCLLSELGADVVAYDAHPLEQLDSNDPGEESGNFYFGSRAYFPVREGVASTVFDGDEREMADRALLVVWPNNPDAEDNKHVAVEGCMLPPTWDLECLEQYHERGGGTVIYAGEREARIRLMTDAIGPDCGFCASRKFQLFLQNHYDLEAELECPRWWMKDDDITIWKRK